MSYDNCDNNKNNTSRWLVKGKWTNFQIWFSPWLFFFGSGSHLEKIFKYLFKAVVVVVVVEKIWQPLSVFLRIFFLNSFPTLPLPFRLSSFYSSFPPPFLWTVSTYWPPIDKAWNHLRRWVNYLVKK